MHSVNFKIDYKKSPNCPRFKYMISIEGELEDGIEQNNNPVISKIKRSTEIHYPEEK